MKLLPRFTSYIKDAAKSVKRISLQEFKEVADETLTELLGIASIVVKMFALRREGEHEVLHLWCTHRDECISLNVVGLYNTLKLKGVFGKQECIMNIHNLKA